jgi:hypothetical protein
MPARKLALGVSLAMLAILTASALPHANAAKDPSRQPRGVASSGGVYSSHKLWATINVCTPRNAPNVVGVRGSMPADGHAGDTMYMRFLLQYYNSPSGKWVGIGPKADSGFLRLGSAATARQAGRSFRLAHSSSRFELRGVVYFEWLRGKRKIYAAERATSAGHKSTAGADPAGFSAASCIAG